MGVSALQSRHNGSAATLPISHIHDQTDANGSNRATHAGADGACARRPLQQPGSPTGVLDQVNVPLGTRGLSPPGDVEAPKPWAESGPTVFSDPPPGLGLVRVALPSGPGLWPFSGSGRRAPRINQTARFGRPVLPSRFARLPQTVRLVGAAPARFGTSGGPVAPLDPPVAVPGAIPSALVEARSAATVVLLGGPADVQPGTCR